MGLCTPTVLPMLFADINTNGLNKTKHFTVFLQKVNSMPNEVPILLSY